MLNEKQQTADELKIKTIRGIGWSVAGQAGNQVLAALTMIVLARLLSPREFGLLAMVVVITSFANIFAEMGLGSALVQKQDIRQEHLSSVFWLNVIAGLILTSAFIICSPLISNFYGEQILRPLTLLISANFAIGSLSIVQRTNFVKTLDFRRLFVADITAVVVSSVVAITMAYAGAGVWSLAAQSVVLTSVTAAMLWLMSAWRPSLIFRWNAIRDLLGFGANLLGTDVLNYWVRNIDYLLIGRFIGSNPLGIYKNAYQVMLFPLTNVSRVISRVMFPALSIIQNEKARVRNIYLQVTRTIALITFPMMAGLFVAVEPLVLAVFGAKWSGMIPLLRVFSIVGLMQSIGTLNGNLYLSQGRADLQFKVSLFVKATAVLGIVIGLRWGIMGVAIGYAVASLLNSYPAFYFAGKLVNLSYWQLWRNLFGVLGCSIAMAAVVFGVGVILPTTLPYGAKLACQIIIGVLIYWLLIHFLGVRAYVETREILLDQYRRFREMRKQLGDSDAADAVSARAL
ncbi:MAG: MOP flippase family protein [Armatimonadota bacterium]|nr:MOP flippase family protein [Armatimonadota bacterium]